MKRPTIKDVARAAGVTYPTVSRVLSNKPYVADETRQRVLEAVRELGYRPSAAARSMVSSRTRSIGILVPNLTDPNFGAMVAGAERAARASGHSVLVSSYDAVGSEVDFFAEHRVDGLILAEPQRFPGHLRDVPGLKAVAMDDVPMDNTGGARTAAEHLRALGHQAFAFIGGPPDSPYALERLEGVRRAAPRTPWLPGDWTADAGARLALEALDGRVTAIVCANDFVAIGAMHALRAAGLTVPRDVSVAGFDDVPIARYVNPPLTTVRQDLEAQGARAAALLLARLDGEPPLPARAPTPLQLIVRESTGAAAPTPPARPRR